jgi:predicted lipid-binding transport protein (Tim44 family)
MSIVDVFSDLVIGLATFLFWRMFTGKPAPSGSAPAPATPAAPAAVPAAGEPRTLSARLEAIWQATGLAGVEPFLAGANELYEALLPAFAAGDIATWRTFIAPDVYQTFQSAIDERNLRGDKAELTFIGIEGAELAEARLTDRLAQIAVRFVGLVVSVTRDSSGKPIAGHPTTVAKTAATWTFEHALGVPGANWVLVATEPEE